MLHDAIEAIRWAWILLKYGSENSINKYVNWSQGLLRKHSQRVQNVQALWEDFLWGIATCVRNKETFATITEELMADLTKTNEILQQPLTKKPRTAKGYGQPNAGRSKDTSPSGRHRAKGDGIAPRTTRPANRGAALPLRTWTPTTPTWPTPTPTLPLNLIPSFAPHHLGKTKDKGNKGNGKKGKGGKGGKK